MKILYGATSYPPAIGGAQLHLHCLARQMLTMQQAVQVVTHTSRNRNDWLRLCTIRCDPQATYQHDGVSVSQIGCPLSHRLQMIPWTLAYYPTMSITARRIASLIGRHLPALPWQPEVVHVSRIGREFLAMALLEYAQRSGIPFVLTPNHHPRWHGALYRQYDHLYRAADAVIALTDAEKQTLVEQKGVLPERVHVTGIGPILAPHHSADVFRRRYQVPGRFVLFLGQQLKYKGVEAVLQAAQHVWRDHPDVHFVFVGPPSDYSRKLFQTYRDPRLRNLGSLGIETKTSALAACELLCLPSMQESFGGVFVEAWAMGKPVIGGRIPPIASVVDDGHDGLLTSQQPEELGHAIHCLLSDPELCETMGTRGRQKVTTKYSWQELARQTLDVYRGLGTGRLPHGQPLRNDQLQHVGAAELCTSDPSLSITGGET